MEAREVSPSEPPGGSAYTSFRTSDCLRARALISADDTTPCVLIWMAALGD